MGSRTRASHAVLSYFGKDTSPKGKTHLPQRKRGTLSCCSASLHEQDHLLCVCKGTLRQTEITVEVLPSVVATC